MDEYEEYFNNIINLLENTESDEERLNVFRELFVDDLDEKEKGRYAKEMLRMCRMKPLKIHDVSWAMYNVGLLMYRKEKGYKY